MESGDSNEITDVSYKVCDPCTTEFVRSLSDLRLNETALDEKGTEDVVKRCLEQFDDTATTPRCRAMALYTIVAQLRHSNPAIVAHVPEVCKRLRHSQVLSVSLTDDGAVSYHTELINALSIFHYQHPEQLVNGKFTTTVHYLVKMVACQQMELSVAACKFWGSIHQPPVPRCLLKLWITAVAPELPTLIHSLIDQMIFRPELASHLEKHPSSCTNLVTNSTQQMPPVLDCQYNLRNYSALAFENVARIFPVEVICMTFRPILEKRINSSSWMEKEAVILAFSAFTEANGVANCLQDLYPILIPRLLDCYSAEEALIRAIACFTMPKLLGQQIRGVKDPMARVLACTGKAMRDCCAEVRSAALRSLATILAHVSGELSNHTARLLDSLVRAQTYEMDPETNCTYNECIGHFIARTAGSLTSDDMNNLMLPLMEQWKGLTWQQKEDSGENEQVSDPELSILPLSHTLSTIAMYSGQLFEPYIECVFSKTCTDLSDMIKALNVADENETRSQDNPSLMKQIFPYLISHIDLLSMTYDGQKVRMGELPVKYKLLTHLYAILTNNHCHEQVHQSALALVGHAISCQAEEPVEPAINDFIAVIESKISNQSSADKTRSNALWSLSQIAKHPSVDVEGLFVLSDRLVTIFECTDGSPPCIINAALALTNICALHVDRALKIILRQDVFLHLCGLLRAPFPRSFDKTTIFHNVCTMLSPATDKIPTELWPVFLSTVAEADSTVADDDTLQTSLRAILRSIRLTLSNAGWAQLLHDVGSQHSSILRRRYKLY